MRYFIITATALALLTNNANAQDFSIDGTSSFIYLPSPQSPGVANCVPDDFNCTFALSGDLQLQVDGDNAFVDLNSIELVGGDALTFLNGNRVNDYLYDFVFSTFQNLQFEQVDSNEWRYSDQPPSSIDLTVQGNLLQMVGGIDDRWFDGDGYNFNLTATLVPEPTLFVILATGLPFLLCGWRRAKRWTA